MYFTIEKLDNSKAIILEYNCITIHTKEQEIATSSNILAWKIPWTEKPGRL